VNPVPRRKLPTTKGNSPEAPPLLFVQDGVMKQKLISEVVVAIVACGALGISAHADERRFTYTYEPEVLPQGGMEFEQSVTLRTQRTSGAEVKQGNYNLWELREEFEYGVTDNYSVSLYLNTAAESYRDFSQNPPQDVSHFDFDGISIENRYMVLNPAEHKLGLTLYLEPRFSGDEAEVEEKIIVGQRCGDWKWAFNLSHATEWADNLHSKEGELEADLGIARDLGNHWSVGLEFRDHNELPEYKIWENTALFVGPVVSYRQEKWWAALTVMPQIFGANFHGNPGGNSQLELEGHERVNIRFMLGISL
jgi:hypothetical protein